MKKLGDFIRIEAALAKRESERQIIAWLWDNRRGKTKPTSTAPAEKAPL